jgi:hypothetical protein
MHLGNQAALSIAALRLAQKFRGAASSGRDRALPVSARSIPPTQPRAARYFESIAAASRWPPVRAAGCFGKAQPPPRHKQPAGVSDQDGRPARCRYRSDNIPSFEKRLGIVHPRSTDRHHETHLGSPGIARNLFCSSRFASPSPSAAPIGFVRFKPRLCPQPPLSVMLNSSRTS